jgi:hypothetical protein
MGTLSERLAFELPVLPWPVLIWIQSQGGYSTGSHSTEALYPVSGLAEVFSLVLTGFGLVLILAGSKSLTLRLIWAIYAGINAMALWTYIESSGVMYA